MENELEKSGIKVVQARNEEMGLSQREDNKSDSVADMDDMME